MSVADKVGYFLGVAALIAPSWVIATIAGADYVPCYGRADVENAGTCNGGVYLGRCWIGAGGIAVWHRAFDRSVLCDGGGRFG